MIAVAIDAVGGTRGPEEVVAGAARASLEPPSRHAVDLVLVGDERRITAELSRLRHNAERIDVRDAPGPAAITEAIRLAGEGRVQAVVSAGPASATIAACRAALTTLPGVRHPALAAVYPTVLSHGRRADPFALLLDVGAALEADADDLVAFSFLGAAYARALSQNDRPRVALLSVGDDPAQSLPAIAEAARRLASCRTIAYVGTVEAVDLPSGRADVVVTAGFSGNAVIKLLDGVRDLVLDLAGYAQKQRLLWRLGVAMLSGGVARLKGLTDWEQYGGAPLLGYPQVILRAHPRSDARAIENACRVAAKAVAADLPSGFAELADRGARPVASA